MNSAQERKGIRQSSTVDLSMGRIPPQAVEIEKAVIGAMLLDKNAIDSVATILKPESFYVEKFQRIYGAILRLNGKNHPVDLLTVIQDLNASGEIETVGGPGEVMMITHSVVSSAHVEHHARIIQQKFLQRELIRTSMETLNEAYDPSIDVFDMINSAEERILSIGHTTSGEAVQIDSVLVKAVTKISEWRQQDSSITGVPSGFPTLDRATRGWQKGNLIIVAARPSVGKTAFALNIVRSATEYAPVAVWSLEMDAVELVLRMLSAESGINLHNIQTGRVDDEQMKILHTKGVNGLSGKKIFFDDNPGLNMFSMRAKARRLKKKHDIGLIVVDYLQLMSADGNEKNREQEISKISRGLKLLAKELKIPVIALSQLNREVEKRKGGVPQLSDIRESGAIEQDADVICLLWGPSEEEIEMDADLLTKRFIRIAKQRNGVLVKVDLDFKNEIQLMTEAGLTQGRWKPIPESGYNPANRD